MQQFVVDKVSRMGEDSWTPRVLTIDPVHHLLYLSQRDNASLIEHHCMVKIKAVNWWPHYSGLFHSTAYFLSGAPLTFCVEGSTLNHGSTSAMKRLFHPRTRRITPAEQAALEGSYALLGREAASVSLTLPGQVYCREDWVLRCMTRDEMEPLLAALRSAVVDPTCIRGSIRLPEVQRTHTPQEEDEKQRAASPPTLE